MLTIEEKKAQINLGTYIFDIIIGKLNPGLSLNQSKALSAELKSRF